MTFAFAGCGRPNRRAIVEVCRFALRSLARSPGFAILCVGSLAAGLGLTAALSTIADAILFRPLPVAHPEEIVRVFTASAHQRLGLSSYPDFDDLRRASATARMVAQSQILIAVATGPGSPAQVRMGLAVTPDYFDVLGIPTAAGRTFRLDEAHDAVVVLAWAFWESHPSALGSRILLSGAPFTVIGVAPKNFSLDRFVHEDFYVPIGVYESGLLPSSGKPMEDRSRRYLSIYARLNPRASLARARAEIAAVGTRLDAGHPESNRGRRLLATTELDARMSGDRTMPALAALLIGVAGLMLAVACANLGGLLILRGAMRSAETAVKIALGASRGRLFLERLAVALLLALAGAALALPVASAALRLFALAATAPSDLRLGIAADLDTRILPVLASAAIAAIACGCLPAHNSRGRWRKILVTGEIALASSLVACAFSLLDSLARIARQNPGFQTAHVLTLALDPAQVRHTEAHARAFYREVLERVGAMSGVRCVALAQSAPLGYTGAQREIEIAGETEPATLWTNLVTPSYLDLLRIPILRGRAFDDRDTAASEPVAIVNEELAKQGGIGARFRMNGRMVRVIGVARTAKYFSLGEAPRPYLYLPFSQNYASRMVLHVETSGDPARAAYPIVAAIHALDAAQPVSEIRPASDYLAQGATFQARVALEATGVVAACGLALALAGLYGMVAQAVAARRREIGIRMAIGARGRTIMAMLVIDAMCLAAVGTCAGLALAWFARRELVGFVPGGHDPAAFAFAAVAVLVLSAGASAIPAARAARIDPARSLRER